MFSQTFIRQNSVVKNWQLVAHPPLPPLPAGPLPWYKYKYKYNSYFYCVLYSLTDGALQKSANTCFTAVDRLK